MPKKKFPKTLDEAVERLLAGMSDASKKKVRETPFDKLIRFHRFWGMRIRNAFGLWRGNKTLMKSCGAKEPDAASMAIIREVWRRLQTVH